MKRPFLFFLVLLTAFYAEAQKGKNKAIQALIQDAYQARKKGEFDQAFETHKKIYKEIRESNKSHILYKYVIVRNDYNYACLYGIIKNKDSCLKYLNLSISTFNGLAPLSEPDLYFLHKYQEWDTLESKILKANLNVLKTIKDKEYAKKLYRLCAADQAYYSDLQLAENKYGRKSREVKDIWKKKQRLNQKNQKELELLLDEKGWPTRSQVGMDATKSAFLIIQHSDLDKMKKYIPILKKLCNEGEGSCQSFALMYDRIQCAVGNPQRYGTQIRYNDDLKKYELFPLENEGLVHEYREWAGLPNLESYAAHWDIKLNIKKVERDFAYADSLVSATLSKHSTLPYFHGADFSGKTKKRPELKRGIAVPVPPEGILGSKIDYCLTMPKGTEVVVKFTDNQIVDYPDQDDLFVKEYGGANDKAVVYVSNDGIKYDSLGITFDGRASSLDLEKIKYSKPVKYVKIISLDNNGALPGYDLVYIKGLPGSNIEAKMNATEIKNYLAKARKEVGMIKSVQFQKATQKLAPFVLKNVQFNTRSAIILKKSIPYLNRLAEELEGMTYNQIVIIGHTDNQGSESSNKKLSLERAHAIKDYLWQQGISKRNIICKGLGASQPLRSNVTTAGRAINRRVELNLVR